MKNKGWPALIFYGGGRGSDRFYAWPDALFYLKKKGFMSVFQFVFI
ncbi:hypothetical protein bpmyx0001_20970 [Bacillus pseudomycoides DSM 12442]|nr:hypothetical protein bpmyx0001_20970 [Bacillus pseudomycoides DSM 12442]